MKGFYFGLFASFFFLVGCDKADEGAKTQYVLGEDDLSLFLEGKAFKYTAEMYLDGERTWVIQFSGKGKRNAIQFCGANGEKCNLDTRGSCYMTCLSFSKAEILIESSRLIEYDDGDRITLKDGKLYFKRGYGEGVFELIESSNEELESLKAEVEYQCASNMNC